MCDVLDRFVSAKIAVEVTHRSARRLFGLIDMTPVRIATTAPRRPIPGRGRARPRSAILPDDLAELVAPPPVSRFEYPPIDYSALEEAMAHCDGVIRSARNRLQPPE